MTELKPCPFCGTREMVADSYHDEDRPERRGTVHCRWCGAMVSGYFVKLSSDEIKKAVAATWNRRPIEDALSASVKELEEKLAEINDMRKCPNCNNCIRDLRQDKVRLESELAQARASTIQWVTYDGTPETLPGIGMTVLFDGADGTIVVYYRSTPEGRSWGHYEIGCDSFPVEIGDRWAYLPTLPEVGKE